MSIRKRLFISNAIMVILPIVVMILIIILLNITLGGSQMSTHFRNGWMSSAEGDAELSNSLIKIASLEEEKLYDKRFLDELAEQSNGMLVVRKGEKILYPTKNIDNLTYEHLPSFANEGYVPVAWFGHDHYSVRQHNFYFKDGSEGSIFLLNPSDSFVSFARAFFPIIFVSLLLILLLTNVLLSYFVSRSILRSVKQLSDASSKISKGDFNFSIKPKSKDELGKLVQTFEAMRSQLKESLELRDKYEENRKGLIANISHDLKTPITSILGYVEGIQVGVANTAAKQERYLETIHAKASYMNRLIEELFLYSTLDLNKLPFTFEEVNIKDFVKDFLDEMEDDFLDKNVNTSFAADDVNSTVRLDRDKLIRVLGNIIYNSVKYMDKNLCQIDVIIEEKESFVEIMISDNGPGVSDKELTTIFNQFYQIDHARHRGGSGLGLAIASQIIEIHGGEIWAENGSEGGLSVHFTLKKSGEKGNGDE
jgi:histidine kinase